MQCTWQRCDCCEHRAVGLKVMQRVETVAGSGEFTWQDCGGVTLEDDAACDDGVGPERQYWERKCDHTVRAQIAPKQQILLLLLLP